MHISNVITTIDVLTLTMPSTTHYEIYLKLCSHHKKSMSIPWRHESLQRSVHKITIYTTLSALVNVNNTKLIHSYILIRRNILQSTKLFSHEKHFSIVLTDIVADQAATTMLAQPQMKLIRYLDMSMTQFSSNTIIWNQNLYRVFQNESSHFKRLYSF